MTKFRKLKWKLKWIILTYTADIESIKEWYKGYEEHIESVKRGDYNNRCVITSYDKMDFIVPYVKRRLNKNKLG